MKKTKRGKIVRRKMKVLGSAIGKKIKKERNGNVLFKMFSELL